MNILIVDDEYEIRNGLATILGESRWDDIPITGVLVAKDSAEALECLARNGIEVVITDIRMSGMDGLGLTETIQYMYPRIPVIILSGYYDQENVRTALRSGASDFLYKPVQLADLQRALRSIMKKHRYEKKKSLHISLQQFRSVSHGQFKFVVAADIDDLSSSRAKQFGDLTMLTWLMNKVATECAEEMDGVCLLSDQTKAETVNLLIGISAPTPGQALEKAQRLSGAVSEFWEKIIRLPVSFGIPSVANAFTPEEYVYHAKCALFARTVQGASQGAAAADVFVSEAEQKTGNSKILLGTLIETGDLEKLAQEVEKTIDHLYQSKEVLWLIKGLESLVVFLYQKITEVFPDGPLKMSDLQLQLQKMLWYRSRDELLQQLKSWVNMALVEQGKEERGGHLLLKAEEYIIKNYRQPLSLTDVANQCYLSPNYLSRLFRERKRMTFLEMLTSVRIENAKRLLHDPSVRIYEIAEAVGYGSWKHFCRVFKEMTNTTPTEYRKKLGH